jgi:6-phosphogluconolactonase
MRLAVLRGALGLLSLVICGCASSNSTSATTSNELAYVGCADAAGTIITFAIDPGTGGLTRKSSITTGSAVSFAGFHPSKKFLYVNHRMVDQVDALAVDPATGALTPLNTVPTVGIPGSMRAGPVFVTVDHGGKFLLVAQYQGSNVLVFALGPDGKIGAQVGSLSHGMNAHMVLLDPTNRFALVPYWGSDLIEQYRFDASTGALTLNDPPSVAVAANSGPRHLALHPNGKWVYLVSEKGGTVTSFERDASKGTLRQTSAVSIMPAAFADPMGPFSSHVEVAPSGRFVYAADRRAAVAVALAVDPATGAVSMIDSQPTQGMTPRDFALAASGGLLIAGNQDSKSVVVFAIDSTSGKLTFKQKVDDVCDLPFFVRTVSL